MSAISSALVGVWEFVAGDDPLSRFVAKPILERVLKANNEDIRAMETVIRASDTSWTLLRPSRLTAGDGRAGYRYRLDVSVRWHYNTTFDTVGRAAVDAISQPDWAGHAVERATARLTPTVADGPEAAHLDVAPGTPLLRIEQNGSKQRTVWFVAVGEKVGPGLVGEFFAEEGFVEALSFDENSFGVPTRVGAAATKGVIDQVDDCGVFGFDCGIEVHRG